MNEAEYVIKPLKNLRNATVFDCETDGLRFEATKVHVLSFKMKDKPVSSISGDNYERMRAFFKWHIDNEVPVVAHNGIGYDIPVLEDLLEIDLTHLMVVDTLPISWYLNVNRVSHGLASFHEDYGIEKPPIDDWENLSYEEYEHRCSTDVAINVALWEDLLSRLEWMYGYVKEEVDKPEFGGVRMTPDEVMAIDQMKGKSVEGYICNCLDYLMSIMFTYRVQEDYGLTLDVDSIESSLKELHEKVDAIKVELEKAMPLIPKYVKKNKPKVMFKKNGELSSAGMSWEEVKKQYIDKAEDENGTRLVLIGKDETTLSNEFGEEFSRPVDDIEQFMVFKDYDAPNANSPQQVKDMLFLHGWVPDVYKDVKDKAAENLYRKQMDAWREIKGRKPPKPEKPEVRQVEQVAVKGDDGGKELTKSVLDLAEKVPAIKLYADYNLFRHRIGVLEGFLKNRDCRGKLVAGLGGLTSTIRQKHRGAVNLPGVMSAYGKNIRGAITADGEDEVLLGSDLSSLESVLGFHFMLPLDPDYVKEMLAPDWDSHLATALAAGLINQKEFGDYKNGIKPDHVTTARKQAKTANYACLPVDNTEVLTKRGWLFNKDIVVGDEVMSISANGSQGWTEVTHKVFYESRQIISMENLSWKVESTPDHRWLIDKIGHPKSGRTFTRTYSTTEGLKGEYNIITTGKYVGGNSQVTPDQAALVGWILSDGYLNVSELTGKTSQKTCGGKRFVKMSVAQSPSKYLSEIESLINRVGLTYSTATNKESGVVSFSFHSKCSRDFLNQVGLPLDSKHNIDYTNWIIGLSYESLLAFVEAFRLADGVMSGRYLKHKTYLIYQKRGKISEAVWLAMHLLGKFTIYKQQGSDETMVNIRGQNKSHVTNQRIVFNNSRVTDVFCLTTKNGNFLMRQGDVMTITGNCQYGAGGETIAKGAGVQSSLGHQLHSGYWAKNWSIKEIAAAQSVINFKEKDGYEDFGYTKMFPTWLINPINGIAYELRKDGDRFSALIQGLGSYVQNRWLQEIFLEQKRRFGKVKCQANFHDEYVMSLRDSEKAQEIMLNMTKQALVRVNQKLNLRKSVECDVQFGQRYSEIH